jgi:4-hydroxy-tetrahydrodipicolinate reductase
MSPSTTSIIVFGATGRTGSRICELAHASDAFVLLARVARATDTSAPAPRAPSLLSPDDARAAPALPAAQRPWPLPENPLNLRRFRGSAHAVIDFSSDAGTREALRAALDLHAALVVGTTALEDATRDALNDASRAIPVLVAPNMSLGVALVARALSIIAPAVEKNSDISIVEAHHRRKLDVPSGTALRLARAIRDAGAPLRDDQILSIRAGDIVGEHTVRFACDGEYIEITHRATSRDLFARGALRAAAWLTQRPPGLYAIEDLIAPRA